MSSAGSGEDAQRADCPLCGPERVRTWAREGPWTVARCKGCGLLLTWPRPDSATLEACYAGESYYEERDMGATAAEAAVERAQGLLAELPGTVTSVLDFGAGQGHLVAAFRRLGLRAEGIEPSPGGRAAARRLYGLALRPDLGLNQEAYDLVTAIHALEHVPDPISAARRVREALTPGGFLLAEVPHAGSVEMWRPRRRRQILDLPVHLYHFTPDTLRAVLLRAGLEPLEVRLTNSDALEWLLALRARLKKRRATRGPAEGRPQGAPSRPAEAARSLWREALLPWLRGHFPGWKFLILARRGGTS